MNSFGTIIAGFTSFVATNIDDIIILTLFFSQVNATFRHRHIVIGQYLGFTALIIASLPGFFGGLIVPKAWIGILGLVPIAIGVSQLVNREKEESEVQIVSDEFNYSKMNNSVRSTLATFFSPQSYKVAAITFANGGDNIGIYVPLFASNDLASLVIILSVFFVLIGVWCYIAYLLTRHSATVHFLTHYAQIITPFVLVGLGIFIIIDSKTYSLFLAF
ncbi:MAG: cadmium resistance transporter [Gloeocapsa sp. UFS-A4-WI-NPMV-4B04]|jgi:cadmium resistance transport/sequestration family protein|nr:cadmium resistance transporter [Gloeocapsa sp. UFS-A4-WI-NPMV-4B04]